MKTKVNRGAKPNGVSASNERQITGLVMSEQQHLLVCLMEECGEVIQACSKALRFGLDDDHQSANPDIVSPRLYIAKELADLDAVFGLLEEHGILPPLDDRQIQRKRTKLAGFMEYAREQGTLASKPDPASLKAGNHPNDTEHGSASEQTDLDL